MTQTAEILFANETFYHMFRLRDVEAMDGLWAQEEPVACIHPGWHALTSRAEVMESWEGILSNPNAPAVACRNARAHVHGDMGFVVCYEVIGDTILVATNVFMREDGRWKLVHHQAGPCTLPAGALEEDDEEEEPSVQ